MQRIPDKSIDMILCDLPYGTTACKWDVIIPLEALWKQYERVIKDNGAIVLTASQPFTTDLINSNRKIFKYLWYWEKNQPTGIALVKTQPMRVVEDIIVFYKGKSTYNKELTNTIITSRKITDGLKMGSGGNGGSHYNYGRVVNVQKTKVNPRNLLKIKCVPNCNGIKLHPTEKPVTLFEYLIKTYTNEGETVLDNCMGSGTTAIACINTNRNYIGFEKEEKYFNIIQERIKKHTPQLKLIA